MNNYAYSSDGFDLTKGFESCRLGAYRDSGGVLSIGYGHTGSDIHPGLVITQVQADALLVKDVQVAVEAVNRLVTVSLTQNHFDSLTDWTFNLGEGTLAGSTLLRILNASDYTGAASEFLAWDHCNGVVVPGLLRRRQAERDLFNKGASK